LILINQKLARSRS